MAPLFGLQALRDGVEAVREAWVEARREGEPRVVTGRYFSLGREAEAIADQYIRHYYGDEYFAAARADTLTSPELVAVELPRLAAAGATDLVLYPSSATMDQIELLAEAVERAAPFERA